MITGLVLVPPSCHKIWGAVKGLGRIGSLPDETEWESNLRSNLSRLGKNLSWYPQMALFTVGVPSRGALPGDRRSVGAVRDREGYRAHNDINHVAAIAGCPEQVLVSLTPSSLRNSTKKKTEIVPLIRSTRFMTARDE
jgi:hypothetical protein